MTEFTWIKDAKALATLRAHAVRSGRLAIDMEADGFFAYSAKPCLWQFSVAGSHSLLDPLEWRGEGPDLAGLFGDDRLVCVFHGADYDLRMMRESYGARPARFEDTQLAAQMLGLKMLGLEALLKERLGVTITKSKRLQRADWSRRPIPGDLQQYAVGDVVHLFALRDNLAKELEEKGRLGWWEEECRHFAPSASAPPPTANPRLAHRMKGAKDLSRRHLAVLEALYLAREERGRRTNRATFRIVGDQTLLKIASRQSGGRPEALELLPPRLPDPVRRSFQEGIQAALGLSESLLPRFDPPRKPRMPKGLPAAMDSLRAARTKEAKRLAMDPGVLLPGRVMAEISRAKPRSAGDLARVAGVREWQVEQIGTAILAALRRVS